MAQEAPTLALGPAPMLTPPPAGANVARSENGGPINVWIRELMCCGYKSKGTEPLGLGKDERRPLIKLLDQVPLFKKLSAEERVVIAKACEEQHFAENTVVIAQGDIGSEFFVISGGQATVTKKLEDGSEQNVVTLRRGDWFGENALLCDEPRVASVTAVSALTTLKLTRQQFRELGLHQKLQFAKRQAVGGGGVRQVVTKPPSPKTEDEIQFIVDALWRNENLATMLNNMDSDKVRNLVSVAWTEEVVSGDTIIKAGDINADHFYVVKKGGFEVSDRLEETDSPSPSQKFAGYRQRSISTQSSCSTPAGHSAEEALQRGGIEVGGCFGELALLYLTQRTATVIAREDSEVWVIDRPNFKRVLMEKTEERIKEYAKMLDSVEILNCLAEEEKRELANAFVEMEFSEGEVILQQGEPGKTFYILYDGEVSVCKDGKHLRDMHTRGQFFGERALLADEPRTATVTAKSSNVRVLALDHESFDMLLGPLSELMTDGKTDSKADGTTPEEKKKARKSMAVRQTMALPTKKLQKVLYEDLKKIGLLGNGGFGCVELFQHTTTGETYALKSMSKGHIVKVGMQNAVINEKNVLMIADSPFVVKLHATFNWPDTICFLLELLLGGELYATYTRENLWGSEAHAKYYGSVVLLAFEHLHSHRVLYRDLKPENVVLDASGIPKLVDMGLAKRVVGKTYTTCGTPDYFAPEVITGAGHNHAVDWWTIGIMIFEMLAGNPPFTASAPMQIFKNVLGGIKRVPLPKKCQGHPGHLIKALLRKEASERLPMRQGGVPNIQKHDWYTSTQFDWEALIKGTMAPPYRPAVKNPTDLANFNARIEDIPKKVTYVDDESGWDLEFDVAC